MAIRTTTVLIASFYFMGGLHISTALAEDCPGISANKQPRLLIPLFQYLGAEQGEARNEFSRYQGIIRLKLETIIDETQLPISGENATKDALGAAVQAPAYVEKIRIHLPSGAPIHDSLTTRDRRQAYWDKTNALELLRGTLWPGTPYFVGSEIYIGDLRGRFPRREIRARLAVEPEWVPSTNDTHSIVTYYALAMDARRLECDPAIVRHLLSRALSILKDLRGREGELEGDLAYLETALTEELEDSVEQEVKE